MGDEDYEDDDTFMAAIDVSTLPELKDGRVFTEAGLIKKMQSQTQRKRDAVGPKRKKGKLYYTCMWNLNRLKALGDLRCPWQVRAKPVEEGKFKLYGTCLEHHDHPEHVSLRVDDGRSSASEEAPAAPAASADRDRNSHGDSAPSEPTVASTSKPPRAFQLPTKLASSAVPSVRMPNPPHEGDFFTAYSVKEARDTIIRSMADFRHDFMPAFSGDPSAIHLVCRQNREVDGMSHFGCCPAKICAEPAPVENTWKITAVNWTHSGHWSDQDGCGELPPRRATSSSGGTADSPKPRSSQQRAAKGKARSSIARAFARFSVTPPPPRPSSSRGKASQPGPASSAWPQSSLDSTPEAGLENIEPQGPAEASRPAGHPPLSAPAPQVPLPDGPASDNDPTQGLAVTDGVDGGESKPRIPLDPVAELVGFLTTIPAANILVPIAATLHQNHRVTLGFLQTLAGLNDANQSKILDRLPLNLDTLTALLHVLEVLKKRGQGNEPGDLMML